MTDPNHRNETENREVIRDLSDDTPRSADGDERRKAVRKLQLRFAKKRP